MHFWSTKTRPPFRDSPILWFFHISYLLHILFALTVRLCIRVLRFKCKNRSQSPHREPQVSHWIIAAVSPSSWLVHMGRVSDTFDHWPDDSFSTWSRSSTQRLASANHMVAVLTQCSGLRKISSKRVKFNTDSAMAALVIWDHFSLNLPCAKREILH